MIYFVQPVDGGPVKIGFSNDVDVRRLTLEAVYGKQLALLATMPGGRDEERRIHERFSHLRLGRTEQFRPAADLMAFIGRPLLVGANPDAVEVLETDSRTLFAVKGVPSWLEWVKEFADSEAIDVMGLMDQAFKELARSKGFPKPMPKRTPKR